MISPERPDEPSDPDAAILELLKRHQEAVQAGRGSEADALAWEVLALAGRRAAEQPSPEFQLGAEVERRRRSRRRS